MKIYRGGITEFNELRQSLPDGSIREFRTLEGGKRSISIRNGGFERKVILDAELD